MRVYRGRRSMLMVIVAIALPLLFITPVREQPQYHGLLIAAGLLVSAALTWSLGRRWNGAGAEDAGGWIRIFEPGLFHQPSEENPVDEIARRLFSPKPCYSFCFVRLEYLAVPMLAAAGVASVWGLWQLARMS